MGNSFSLLSNYKFLVQKYKGNNRKQPCFVKNQGKNENELQDYDNYKRHCIFGFSVAKKKKEKL